MLTSLGLYFEIGQLFDESVHDVMTGVVVLSLLVIISQWCGLMKEIYERNHRKMDVFLSLLLHVILISYAIGIVVLVLMVLLLAYVLIVKHELMYWPTFTAMICGVVIFVCHKGRKMIAAYCLQQYIKNTFLIAEITTIFAYVSSPIRENDSVAGVCHPYLYSRPKLAYSFILSSLSLSIL